MVESNFSSSGESVNAVVATSENAASIVALGFVGTAIITLALIVFLTIYNWKLLSKTIKEKGDNVQMIDANNLTLWFILSFFLGFLAIVTIIFLIFNKEWKRLIIYIIVNIVAIFVPTLVFTMTLLGLQ